MEEESEEKAVDRLTKSEHHILCGILASFWSSFSCDPWWCVLQQDDGSVLDECQAKDVETKETVREILAQVSLLSVLAQLVSRKAILKKL